MHQTVLSTVVISWMLLVMESNTQPIFNGCWGDMIFVMDASSSIWVVDYRRQLEFVANLVETFDIGPGPKQVGISAITFSDRAHLDFPLDRYQNLTELKDAILHIPYRMGGTNTAKALKLLSQVAKPYVALKRRPLIAVVITDGLSYEPALTKKAAKELHKLGINIHAIGVGDHYDMEELRIIASDPVNGVHRVYSYSALNDIADKFRVKLCKVTTAQATTLSTEATSSSMTPTKRRMAEDALLTRTPGISNRIFATTESTASAKAKEASENKARSGMASTPSKSELEKDDSVHPGNTAAKEPLANKPRMNITPIPSIPEHGENKQFPSGIPSSSNRGENEQVPEGNIAATGASTTGSANISTARKGMTENAPISNTPQLLKRIFTTTEANTFITSEDELAKKPRLKLMPIPSRSEHGENKPVPLGGPTESDHGGTKSIPPGSPSNPEHAGSKSISPGSPSNPEHRGTKSIPPGSSSNPEHGEMKSIPPGSPSNPKHGGTKSIPPGSRSNPEHGKTDSIPPGSPSNPEQGGTNSIPQGSPSNPEHGKTDSIPPGSPSNPEHVETKSIPPGSPFSPEHGGTKSIPLGYPSNPEHGGPNSIPPGSSSNPEHGGTKSIPPGSPSNPEHVETKSIPPGSPFNPEHGGTKSIPPGSPPNPEHGGPNSIPPGRPSNPEHGGTMFIPQGSPSNLEQGGTKFIPPGSPSNPEHGGIDSIPPGSPSNPEHGRTKFIPPGSPSNPEHGGTKFIPPGIPSNPEHGGTKPVPPGSPSNSVRGENQIILPGSPSSPAHGGTKSVSNGITSISDHGEIKIVPPGHTTDPAHGEVKPVPQRNIAAAETSTKASGSSADKPRMKITSIPSIAEHGENKQVPPGNIAATANGMKEKTPISNKAGILNRILTTTEANMLTRVKETLANKPRTTTEATPFKSGVGQHDSVPPRNIAVGNETESPQKDFASTIVFGFDLRSMGTSRSNSILHFINYILPHIGYGKFALISNAQCTHNFNIPLMPARDKDITKDMKISLLRSLNQKKPPVLVDILRQMHNELFKDGYLKNGEKPKRQIGVLFVDPFVSEINSEVLVEADEMKGNGFELFVISIGSVVWTDVEMFTALSSQPFAEFLFSVPNHENLPQMVKHLPLQF